jgi:outer membrane protein OmpA-like peptidoglycan-associated protein
MNYHDQRYCINIVVLLSVFSILSACASTPETPLLDQARASYNKAENDPDVSKYAPVEMYEAKKSLDMADSAKDQKEREHYAYLAQKRTEIAMTQAEHQKAEKEVSALSKKRQDILMKKREMELQAAKAEAAGLKEELAGLQAKQTKRGLVVTMGGVLFKLNEADLMPGAMRTIDQLAQFLKNHPEYNASIEGHTDSTGSASYNQQLSERRAESVSTAIQVRGIDAERLMAKGLGENYPVATNSTDAGRQQNRRVEIVLMQE